MTQLIKRSFSNQWLSIYDINRLHNLSIKGLRKELNEPGHKTNFDSSKVLKDRFGDFNNYKDWFFNEMNHLYGFQILSELESRFRVDFIIRTDTRLKDPISKSFQNLFLQHSGFKQYQFPISKIVDIWIEKDERHNCRSILNKFLRAIDEYRNWLAHGRYWFTKFNIEHYDYDWLFNLAMQIETLLGNDLKHFDPNLYKELNQTD